MLNSITRSPLPAKPTSGAELNFRPETLRGRVRFALAGRAVLWAALRDAARLPLHAPQAQRQLTQRRAAGRVLRHLRVHVDATGLECAHGGPFVVVALHEGITDVLVLTCLPLPLRFVARDEIFTWPGVGPAITRLGHVSIDPEAGASGYRRLLHAARAVTRAGESLVVFPQGTVLGIEADFQRGAFLLARHLRLPILPVVVTGTHRVWEHPFTPTLRYAQRVALRVLPPVPSEDVQATTPDELRVHLRRAMKRVALDPTLPAARRYVPERDGYWDGFRFDIDPDFPDLHHLVAAHRRRHPSGAA